MAGTARAAPTAEDATLREAGYLEVDIVSYGPASDLERELERELGDEAIEAAAREREEPRPPEEEPEEREEPQEEAEPEVTVTSNGAGAEPREAAPSGPPASFESHMEIRFAKLSENATLPDRAHEGDAGMDLRAAESARIGPGQRVGVGTGLAVEIPEGWAGMILPRSGLALKSGIALVNSPGLIDPGYRGEIRVLLLNTDATSEFKVAVGDRIAQLVLTPFSTAKPVEADQLEAGARGEGGFGSSGT